ncbi:MAG: glycosyltransferase [Candidatus Heimdallarchaeota archaeon]|nr:glycosyltransferase [Candidatus Heimdallarchaeota archaeon]
MDKIIILHFKEFSKDPRLMKQLATMQKYKIFTIVITLFCDYYIKPSPHHEMNILYKNREMDKLGGRKKFNFLYFYIWSINWFIKNRGSIRGVICNDLPTLPIGVIFKIINWRTKIIYDSHELFPDLTKEYFGYLGQLPSLFLEKLCMTFKPYTITVSTNLLKVITKRYKPHEISIIPNFPSKDIINNTNFKNLVIDKQSLQYDITFIYPGTMAIGRGYEEIIDAFIYLNKQNMKNTFSLIFIGEGPLQEKLKSIVNSSGVTNIYFNKYISQNELYAVYPAIDYGICILPRTVGLNNFFGLPNKILEYITFKMNIISTNLPSAREFIKNQNLWIIEEFKLEFLIKLFETIILNHKPIIKEEIQINTSEMLFWENYEINYLKGLS